MERVQSPVSAESETGVVPSLAPLEHEHEPAPVDLAALADTARNAPGSEGRDAHEALRRALETLTPSEANGRALLDLLDQHAFDGLLTDDGGPTRELAVETLLRLGYPWALQIHPDELSWYRGSISERARRRRLLILLSILGAELAVWAALYLSI